MWKEREIQFAWHINISMWKKEHFSVYEDKHSTNRKELWVRTTHAVLFYSVSFRGLKFQTPSLFSVRTVWKPKSK